MAEQIKKQLKDLFLNTFLSQFNFNYDMNRIDFILGEAKKEEFEDSDEIKSFIVKHEKDPINRLLLSFILHVNFLTVIGASKDEKYSQEWIETKDNEVGFYLDEKYIPIVPVDETYAIDIGIAALVRFCFCLGLNKPFLLEVFNQSNFKNVTTDDFSVISDDLYKLVVSSNPNFSKKNSIIYSSLIIQYLYAHREDKEKCFLTGSAVALIDAFDLNDIVFQIAACKAYFEDVDVRTRNIEAQVKIDLELNPISSIEAGIKVFNEIHKNFAHKSWITVFLDGYKQTLKMNKLASALVK